MLPIDQKVKEIESLQRKDYLPKEYVYFYRDLVRCQWESKGRVLIDIPAEEMDRRLKEGVHLLDFDRLEIEEEPLKHLFLKICEAIQRYGKRDGAELDRLKKAAEELDLGRFVRKAALGDADYFESLSDTLQVEKEYLLFLGIHLGKPFFELWAERVRGQIEDRVWRRGTCPVCGHEPAMARLEREHGRRILQCSLCSTEWTFRRMQCPFCSNDDHNRLRFFFVEEASPYRVDVCEECKRYIKTIDERKVEEGREVTLAVENVATIHLDILASKQGYRSPEFCLFDLSEESVIDEWPSTKLGESQNAFLEGST